MHCVATAAVLARRSRLDPRVNPGVGAVRERHARALRTAREEVQAFIAAIDAKVPAEFAVTHLREAIAALEELIGVVSIDDVLDRVFGDFCVGK